MGAHVHLCGSLVLRVKAYTLQITYVFLGYIPVNHLICPTHQTGDEVGGRGERVRSKVR